MFGLWIGTSFPLGSFPISIGTVIIVGHRLIDPSISTIVGAIQL